MFIIKSHQQEHLTFILLVGTWHVHIWKQEAGSEFTSRIVFSAPQKSLFRGCCFSVNLGFSGRGLLRRAVSRKDSHWLSVRSVYLTSWLHVGNWMPKSHWERSRLFTSAQLLCFDMDIEIRGYNKWSDDAMLTVFIRMLRLIGWHSLSANMQWSSISWWSQERPIRSADWTMQSYAV